MKCNCGILWQLFFIQANSTPVPFNIAETRIYPITDYSKCYLVQISSHTPALIHLSTFVMGPRTALIYFLDALYPAEML